MLILHHVVDRHTHRMLMCFRDCHTALLWHASLADRIWWAAWSMGFLCVVVGFCGRGVPPLVKQSSDSVSLDLSRDSHKAVKPLCNLSTEVPRAPWFVQSPFWFSRRRLCTAQFTRCQFSLFTHASQPVTSLLSHLISFSSSCPLPLRQSPS